MTIKKIRFLGIALVAWQMNLYAQCANKPVLLNFGIDNSHSETIIDSIEIDTTEQERIIISLYEYYKDWPLGYENEEVRTCYIKNNYIYEGLRLVLHSHDTIFTADIDTLPASNTYLSRRLETKKYDYPERGIFMTNYFKLKDTRLLNDTLQFYTPLYQSGSKQVKSLLLIYQNVYGVPTNTICITDNIEINKKLNICNCVYNIDEAAVTYIRFIKKMKEGNCFLLVTKDFPSYTFYLLII